MAGITVLIFGSVYASNSYFFYCNLYLKHIYNTLSLIVCSMVFIATMMEYFHRPENLSIKGKLFGALGIINGALFIHWLYAGIIANKKNHNISLNFVYLGILIMGFLYLTGLSFYIKKYPESKYPGKFDNCGTSHNIFHLFVFLSSTSYYVTLTLFYE